MKPMILNTMLYDQVNERVKVMSINDFRDIFSELRESNDNDSLKEIEFIDVPKDVAQDCNYIGWQIFDEISERVYIMEGERYANKDEKPIADESTIKNLTDGEQVGVNLELCNENGDVIDYIDY